MVIPHYEDSPRAFGGRGTLSHPAAPSTNAPERTFIERRMPSARSFSPSYRSGGRTPLLLNRRTSFSRPGSNEIRTRYAPKPSHCALAIQRDSIADTTSSFFALFFAGARRPVAWEGSRRGPRSRTWRSGKSPAQSETGRARQIGLATGQSLGPLSQRIVPRSPPLTPRLTCTLWSPR